MFSTIYEFTTLQFFLICPLDPVSGLIFPILIMELAKSAKKRPLLVLYLWTKLRVVVLASSLENKIWSELRRPFPLSKFWK